jgi:hypothetical protein
VNGRVEEVGKILYDRMMEIAWDADDEEFESVLQDTLREHSIDLYSDDHFRVTEFVSRLCTLKEKRDEKLHRIDAQILAMRALWERFNAANDPIPKLASIASQILRLKHDTLAIVASLPHSDKKTLEESARISIVTSTLEDFLRAYREDQARERERVRHDRITARAAAQPVPDPILCARCQKKPRHFDQWCKRCANTLGVRPTGKVA